MVAVIILEFVSLEDTAPVLDQVESSMVDKAGAPVRDVVFPAPTIAVIPADRVAWSSWWQRRIRQQ